MMIQTFLYFFALLIGTIVTWKKKKNILGIVLLVFYTGSAFFSVAEIGMGLIDTSDVTLLPYVLLLVAYALYMFPFLNKKMDFSIETDSALNKKYYIFAYVYIICTILTVKVYMPSVMKLVQNGNWALNRNNLYQGEMVFPDANIIDHIASLFSGYTQLLAIIVGFELLRRKSSAILAYAILVCSALKTICGAIYTSSRGSIATFVMLIIAIYLFYYSAIEENKRRFFSILTALGICLAVPFFVEVTLDRFANATSASNSIVDYLGKAPIAFNYGVFCINKIMWGEYAFGNLFGQSDFAATNIGGKWGTSFYTFVGWIYIDWGFLGVLIIGVLSLLFWNYYFKRRTWKISDRYLVFSYFNMLLQGVFVIGRDYCYTIMMTIVIYIGIKIFFDKYTYRLGRYTL